MMRDWMLLLLLAFLLGCQPAPPRGIEVTRVAKLLTEGTSRVMGSVRVPAKYLGSEGGDRLVAGARVQLVDAEGHPVPQVPETKTDAYGTFTFSAAPLGVSMRAKVSYPVGDQTLTLYKYLRPSESITCAHVDLATTLVADKLTDANPLARSDPGLVGAEVFEFADPGKLQAVESKVRAALREGLAQPVDLSATERNTAEVFDQIVQEVPQIADSYQDSFERPDCSLGVRIMSAPLPADKHQIFGILRLRSEGVPADTVRVEYRLNGKTAVQGAKEEGLTLDTWQYPNGPYLLEAIAVRQGGHRESIVRTYVQISNTLEAYCPLPD